MSLKVYTNMASLSNSVKEPNMKPKVEKETDPESKSSYSKAPNDAVIVSISDEARELLRLSELAKSKE